MGTEGLDKGRAGGRMVALLLALLFLFAAGPARADDPARLVATAEDGFARLVLSFPDRRNLPEYHLSLDNGVVALTFTDPIGLDLPDLAAALPAYVTVARQDADKKGIRVGLTGTFTVHRMEAGENLYVDLLPPNWQGPPPPLPPKVVEAMAERARQAAISAARKQRAEETARIKPVAELRVGRNPTFLRLEFDWSAPTKAGFTFQDNKGTLDFDWPVPVDISAFRANLPAEIKSAENTVGPDGTEITFAFVPGLRPRFYAVSDTEFILDVAVGNRWIAARTLQQIAADRQKATMGQSADTPPQIETESAKAEATEAEPAQATAAAQAITPYASAVGSTIRIVFPFDRDTPAAAFRRGDTLWLLFDTLTLVNSPPLTDAMAAVMSGFTVIPSAGAQIVRIDLSAKKLAALGSEGRAWVLSIGDQLLTPTEPITFERRQDADGLYEMTADLNRAGKVHRFRDPVVGDILTVVTAYPPARGLTRRLDYVDFAGLRSIHGLVIKPMSDAVAVRVDGQRAIISAPDGLAVSPLSAAAAKDAVSPPEQRAGWLNLASMLEADPIRLVSHRDRLMSEAALAQGEDQARARLDLSRFLIANRLGFEALGVLEVVGDGLKDESMGREVRRQTAIADVLAGRPKDALAILNGSEFDSEADSLMWRSIARTDLYDFKGAKVDAAAAEGVVEDYPAWVRNRFWLAATRDAVETGSPGLAQSNLAKVDFASLEGDDVPLYHLLSGRIAEAEGREQEALDAYGQVIAADRRPTRAEAVYRTLLVLDRQGRLDLGKAIDTLSGEVMVWRGNPLEADMDKLLAELYFRKGDYRAGFDTVKSAVEFYPESPPMTALQKEAEAQFRALFLDGRADALDPVTALGIFYDFRALTPPGADGDRMIRNLARRLIRLDLLDQAASLLDYQVKNRLTGAARAQVGADLAVVLIADRRPQDALNALHITEIADLPPTLARQRRVLEARALIDGGRDNLALDLLSKLEGPDVDQLRIEANWNAKNYEGVGQLLEDRYAAEAKARTLSETARSGILKAAVSYVLADDRLGLGRLRQKFADAMASAPEWPMFDYLTGAVSKDARRFKQEADALAATDSLDAFLAAYDKVYAGDGLTPLKAARREG